MSRGVERPAWRRLATPILLTALVGAVFGMGLATPRYRCEGLVRVDPRVANPEDPCGPQQLPMFAGFMAYQEQLLRARRTTLLALDTEVWRETGEASGADAAESFEARRDVVLERGWSHLLVHFEDERPAVALAGLRALLEAYEGLARASEDEELLEYGTAQQKQLQERLAELTTEIEAITAEYGGVQGLQAQDIEIVSQVLETEWELERVRAELHGREAGLGGPQEELRAEVARLEERLEQLRRLSRGIGQTRVDLERMLAQRADLERQAERMEVLVFQLESQLLGTGVITIENRGTLPTAPLRGSRPAAAATGAGLGALLGLLLAVLLCRRRRP